MLLLCFAELQLTLVNFCLSSELFEFGFEQIQYSNENVSKH